MFRYKAVVEYDGSFFCGWQSQGSDQMALKSLTRESFFCQKDQNEGLAENKEPWSPKIFLNGLSGKGILPIKKPSVQGLLEKAIENLTGMQVLVEGAGRTDAGVHATGQVIHFDLPLKIDPFRLRAGLNFYLRNLGAVVLEIYFVDSDFHARFSATLREYQYVIINRRAPLSLEANRAWHVAIPLDVDLMNQAASFLIGYHNFESFRSRECQAKTPYRTLQVFSFEVVPHGRIVATIQALSFLHNQVRIMIGTLVLVGKKKIKPEKIRDLLQACDRTQAGPTAPAHGLFLTHVSYDRDEALKEL